MLPVKDHFPDHPLLKKIPLYTTHSNVFKHDVGITLQYKLKW